MAIGFPPSLRFECFFCEGIPVFQLFIDDDILPNCAIFLLQVIPDRIRYAISIRPDLPLASKYWLKREKHDLTYVQSQKPGRGNGLACQVAL